MPISTSSQVIEVLQNHGFNSVDTVASHASSLSPSRQMRVLDDIGTLRGRNLEHLLADLRTDDDEIAFFPEVHTADALDVPMLTSMCFYADRVIVPNPLITINPEINKALRSSSDANAQQVRFVEAIESILKIEPLIQAGVIRLYPREIWTDTQPYLRIQNYEKDVLNDPLKGYARTHIKVKSSRMGPNMQIITEMDAEERPSRVVSMFFDDESPSDFHFFSDPDFTNYNRQADGSVKFVSLLDTGKLNRPIDTNNYKTWRDGCLQRSVLARANLCLEHLLFSQQFNSSFVASYPSSWDILRLVFDNKSISKSARPNDATVGAAMLQLTLPYLSSIGAKDLVSLRNQSNQFEAFRRALRDFERDLRSQPGTLEFAHEVKQLQKDRLEAPLASLAREQRRVKEKFFVNTLIALASIGVSAQTKSLLPMTAALQTFAPLVNLSRDKETAAKNAVYFLWLAQQKTKRKK